MSMARLPPLAALRAFEAAARCRSFTLAAEELRVTPSAVSHQLRQLEASVGVRLLDRSPRSVSLTPAGQTLLEATIAGFDVIARAINGLRADVAPRMVTLTATAAFLSLWLMPRLASLRSAMPSVDIRFHASNTPETLLAGTLDVAIRYGPGPFQGSVKLWDDELTPVCSPTLNITCYEDLRHAVLLHVAGRRRPERGVSWEEWCTRFGVVDVQVWAGPHLPDSMSAVQAAIAGQGIAIISRRLVADAIKAGLLVAPFASSITGDAFHFLSADGIEQSDPVTRLRSWFSEQA